MTVDYAPRTQTAAVARALTFNGKPYPAGWCQAFVVTQVFGTGGVGDYDGDRAADAEDGWKKARDRGRVVKVPTGLSAAAMTAWLKAIPAGYMAYWTGGSSDHGHAATTLGNGKLFTTDKTPGVCGIVDITWPHTHWGLTFVGYATVDGNGFTLTDRQGTSTPPVAVWGKPETFVLGATGPDVTKLGQRIVVWSKALGLPSPYRSGPGSPLTVTDVNGLAKIQKAWGDRDADGYPGPLTFTRLAAEPPPAPATRTTTVEVLFLPTAGYNGDSAKGVTRWKSNTDGLAALVRHLNPDVVGTTEMSNRETNPMLPRFEAALPRYEREPGGTDGRYWFRQKATTDHVASGHVEASNASELNDDDKQGAWTVNRIGGLKVQAIVAHAENEDGIDKAGANKGANADDLRVTQAQSILGRAIAAGAEYEPDVIIYVGDFNSEKRVRDQLVSQGWRAIGPGFFTRWDDSVREPFDWGFIKVGTATVEVINHAFGDHTALLIRWTITH